MPKLFSLCVAAILLTSTAAGAVCLPSKGRKCVDLSGIPDAARQVIGSEELATTKAAVPPPAAVPTPYTGPTIGFSNMIRSAPEIGYHWSIN
ncbi:MAG TPA: hypothetical protein VND87_13145 [Stellaceae bacterium]|nr:hypothetical protein [Stellaceae bacterium]